MKDIVKKTKKFVGEHQELVLGVGTLTAVFLGGIYLGKGLGVEKLSKLVDKLEPDQFCKIVKTSAFSSKPKSFVLVNREFESLLLSVGISKGKMRGF